MAVKRPRRALLKFGGEVVADGPRMARVLRDVAALQAEGWRFVLCHGAGPQASALSDRLGLNTRKVGGRRVTDLDTLEVMKMTLAGSVSVSVVTAALAAGIRAVGISGVSDGLVTAHRRPPARVSGGGDELVDFGLVGDILALRVGILETLWESGYTPVVNSLGVDYPGSGDDVACTVLNINADTVASAIAAALSVDHLFLMTGVPGVLRSIEDPSSRIAQLSRSEARQAINEGVIVGGMIPKVEDALEKLEMGIGAVHILAAEPGDLEREARAPGSCGTVLVADGGSEDSDE